MWDLNGQVAIVTGGGRGLGLSISMALAQAGAKVAVVYPPFEQRPDQAMEEIRKLGTQAEAYEADVTKVDDVSTMVKNVLADFDKVDILVNNAGKMKETLLIDMDVEEWDDTITTDLRSVFICSKAIIAHMIKQRKGAIINIASQIGYKGAVRLTHYAAAKAGVIALTKSLAQEVAQFGVRVNAVAPGPLETDMTRPFMVEAGWLESKQKSVALGRLATPDEVAPTVVFLASSAAAIYVGQTLLPNSGGVML